MHLKKIQNFLNKIIIYLKNIIIIQSRIFYRNDFIGSSIIFLLFLSVGLLCSIDPNQIFSILTGAILVYIIDINRQRHKEYYEKFNKLKTALFLLEADLRQVIMTRYSLIDTKNKEKNQYYSPILNVKPHHQELLEIVEDEYIIGYFRIFFLLLSEIEDCYTRIKYIKDKIIEKRVLYNIKPDYKTLERMIESYHKHTLDKALGLNFILKDFIKDITAYLKANFPTENSNFIDWGFVVEGLSKPYSEINN